MVKKNIYQKKIEKVGRTKAKNDKKSIYAFNKEMKENYKDNDIGEMYHDAWRYNSKALDRDLKIRGKF